MWLLKGPTKKGFSQPMRASLGKVCWVGNLWLLKGEQAFTRWKVGRGQYKEWGVYSRLEETSGPHVKTHFNWLGVATPSVVMKDCGVRWQMLLKSHSIIHPQIHSIPPRPKFTCGLSGQFFYMLSASHWNNLWPSASLRIFWLFRSPGTRQPKSLTRFNISPSNLHPVRNESWKNTQASPSPGDTICMYKLNSPQRSSSETESSRPH